MLPPDILLGLITVVMAVLGGIVSAHAPTNIRHKTAYIVAFICLGCFAWVVVIQQSRQTTKSETELRSEITRLTSASSEITRLQSLNNKLEEQLLDLGRMNTSLVKENTSVVTGGDSICYMDFMYQVGQPIPVFVHVGRYPLYDLDVRIVDLVKMRKRFAEHLGVDLASDVSYKIREFQAGKAWIDQSLSVPFSDQREQDFNVFFSARNGIWTEQLRLRNVSGQWVKAIQVFFSPYVRSGKTSKPSPKPIYEEVSKEFPRNADGTVPW